MNDRNAISMAVKHRGRFISLDEFQRRRAQRIVDALSRFSDIMGWVGVAAGSVFVAWMIVRLSTVFID